ncbi:proteasome A-type and B-type domain-containing protein [Neospora caninum Liverpool]|uniref:Proteasome subunit beta n=1 Tax=Neospora caninum (strain Liverpool) TaxID=572307 RepID=F0VEL5_NEOCL|nr:proteasome A-type and B-type domain-containing protein [Neospora caninum Liverpool]CBZ52159.1 proteasome A-type and B-type domain-containing protein [Neospora caninum Liverpool]CEL66123.1 TPA: proteasome A-type and B-type domain-containing protein, putative [Neospora caninum Liverpool]|eukprot:XP_003882191.1 proteasome A-type and B-type domain-containing protein [Neospora caninum Liverpool]
MASLPSPLDLQAMAATQENTLTGLAPRDTTVPIVTTSSVLGITYKDGILMVADTLASYGRMTRFKDTSRFFTLGTHTAVASTGDYSDHQMLERTLSRYALKDFLHDDNSVRTAHQYGALLSRLMYQKRSRMNPWWLSVIVGGYQGERTETREVSDKCAKPFVLGYVDMYGTFYEEDVIATGLGRYFAITLMRNRHRPDMSEDEARQLLEECMRLLFYRDCGASNRIQFTKITTSGVTVEEPYVIDSKWDYEHYVKKTMDMGLAGCAW